MTSINKFSFIVIVSVINTLISCSSDDGGRNKNSSCVTCSLNNTGPKEQICEGENGNAIRSGTDTGVKYQQYLGIIRSAGGNCN